MTMDGLEHWTHYTRFVVTLIAVVDPFMAMPIFLQLCSGRPDDYRVRLARGATFTVLAVLVGAVLAGDTVLRLLGTSFAAFQVGGGLVLLLMALAMLQATPGIVRPTDDKVKEDAQRDGLGVVPLAIPLLAGPGAISTVMIAAQRGGWAHQAAIVGAIGLVVCLLWLMLRLAKPIEELLGPVGLNIANRLLGMLLAAIAVESMATGLRGLFPALAGT